MKRLCIITAMVFCLAPSTASAEWILTPFVGVSFAGGSDTVDDVLDEAFEENKLTYGGTLTYLGAGIFGFEVDFATAPNYFEPGDDDLNEVEDSNYTSLMANVILSVPRGAFRPYVTAGAGMLKTFVDGPDDFFDVDRNALGFNLGGGVFGFVTDRVGIRGDLRYFRQMGEADDDEIEFDLKAFRFWRGSVGVSFRF